MKFKKSSSIFKNNVTFNLLGRTCFSQNIGWDPSICFTVLALSGHNKEYGVSLGEITRSVHSKFNCIIVNFDRKQHCIY